MADTLSTRRALLGAMAAASALPIVPIAAAAESSSDFDAALLRYSRARDIEDHEWAVGDLRAAYEAYDRGTRPLEARYGRFVDCTGADQERWKRCNEAMNAAEDRHTERFRVPRSAAFEVLAATPAPTIAALMLKIDLAGKEAVDAEEIVDFVQRDLRRLGAN